MHEQIDGQTDRQERWREEQTDRHIYKWIDRKGSGWIDGYAEEWTDGQTDRRTG